jgi:transposase
MCQNQFLFHKKDSNTTEAIARIIDELKSLPKFRIANALFGMEATGIYCNFILHYLKKQKAQAVVENPLIIKNFLRHSRGKDDRTDAIRIASYLQKNKDEIKIRGARRPVILELTYLFTLRSRMLATSTGLKNPLKEQEIFIPRKQHAHCRKLCEKTMLSLKDDLLGVDVAIDQLVYGDPNLLQMSF